MCVNVGGEEGGGRRRRGRGRRRERERERGEEGLGGGGRWWWWSWWYKKRAGASAPAPSAGLTSRKKTYALSLRRQVPGVSGAKRIQPQGEEKDCEARPLSLPTPTEEGGAQSFPSISALNALDPE